MSIAVSAFITLALAEIRSARAGDVVGPDDADLALQIFNELLDFLNADERALYSTSLQNFTLTPNLNPHTIGIDAPVPPKFVVSIARPNDIVAADLRLANNIRIPLTRRDRQWWMDRRAPAVTSATPTDFYYEPTWPNGQFWLWPVVTANNLLLQLRTLLASVAWTDTFDLPPGYQKALRLTLAEALATPFGQTVSEATRMQAQEARALVWGDNDPPPRLVTADAGMPCAHGGGFNYLTGTVGRA